MNTYVFQFCAVILYQIVRINVAPAHTDHHLQNPEFYKG